MKIKLAHISIRELVQNYKDNEEDGVVGYGGHLDIRPPYQREFVYNAKQREAVINTVMKGFPLNIMYWAVTSPTGFEIIDGQQRTISICQYVNGDFSVDNMNFHNFESSKPDIASSFLDYELTVYICEGSESDKLDWFRTINIAGEELTEQELRNAVYHGPWLTDAKKYFSRTGCAAYHIGHNYVSGIPIRQDYLQTAIKWINDGDIEDYMAKHQSDANAAELWQHYQGVIQWIERTFPEYRREMKGLDWGKLYKAHYQTPRNSTDLEVQIKKLMMDDDVTKKKGIYQYLLTDNEKYLNIRAFTAQQRREVFERQSGNCVSCGGDFTLKEMEADHITPWSKGGKTNIVNCQMLCMECNRRKSGL